MKRTLGFAALALVLLGAGLLLRWTVFLDLDRFRETVSAQAALVSSGDFYQEMARRTHRGDGPCLRYVDRAALGDEELGKAADEAEASGLAEQIAPFFPLFLRWAEERDAPHHARDEAEELLDATRERIHGINRVILSLQFGRLLRRARATNQATLSRLVAEAERKAAAADPALRARLRALWEHHPLACSLAGAIRMAPELKRRLTVARMDRIARAAAAFRAAHGQLPDRLEDLPVPPADLRDGWYRDIQYERTGQGARLFSVGHPDGPRIERELR
jgi:hypothetical protein